MKKEYFHRYPESHLHKSTFGKPNFRDFYANIKFKAFMRLTTPGIEKFVKNVNVFLQVGPQVPHDIEWL